MIDYTGKLNEKKDYLRILEKLKSKTSYIEIVILDGKKTNELVTMFQSDIISHNKVNRWWGTITKGQNNLYRIKSSDELFNYLKKFETFCKYYHYGTTKKSLNHGDYSEDTDFGIDDIAFYDINGNTLLNTTTHEGYILISEEIML